MSEMEVYIAFRKLSAIVNVQSDLFSLVFEGIGIKKTSADVAISFLEFSSVNIS